MAEPDGDARPLQVAGGAIVVFTLTARPLTRSSTLEQQLGALAGRLREDYGTEINADRVAGR